MAGVIEPVGPCSGTEFTVSLEMMAKYVAGFVASSSVRVSHTQPAMSWPHACASLPQVEQPPAEYMQLLSALRIPLVQSFTKKPGPTLGSSAMSTATQSDMPSP